tara:strand:- start:213 stop:530 length:318 start_codon:yes stop_codon:yes gene_type:complete
MLSNKQKLVISLQHKVGLHFQRRRNDTHLRQTKNEHLEDACKKVIWMFIEKGYSRETACRLMAKKSKFISFTNLKSIIREIVPDRILKLNTKVNQAEFFDKLELV